MVKKMQENIIQETDYTKINSLTEIIYPIVNIEEPELCKLKVHYEADPEVVLGKIEEAISHIKKLKISGFRPGKAPDHVVKTKLRPQIDQFVVREMASQAVDDIIFEAGIKLIGQPQFSDIKINGNRFSCTVELLKKPEFELKNYKFDVQKPVVNLDEEVLVESSLQNLRMKVGDVEPYDENDVVEVNDQITISFTASIDNKEFDGSILEGEMYTVGQNRWKGFDNYLLGMKADETREFDFVFEDDSPLIEKTAHFIVTVHMGTKRKPHEINEEFLQKLGVKTIEELKEKLTVISKDSIKRQEIESLRNQVAIKLIENNQIDIPNYLIEIESKNIALNSGWLKEQIESNLVNPEDMQKFRDQGAKNIKLSLILDSIRENEPDAILSNSEVQQRLLNHPALQGQDIGALMKNPQVAQQIQMLISTIREEFTLQWTVNNCNIIE